MVLASSHSSFSSFVRWEQISGYFDHLRKNHQCLLNGSSTIYSREYSKQINRFKMFTSFNRLMLIYIDTVKCNIIFDSHWVDRIWMKSCCTLPNSNFQLKYEKLPQICVDLGFVQSLLAFVAFNKKQSFQTLHLLVVFH